MKRVTFGTYPNEALRKQGFTPARLQGDWLPDKWLQLFTNELRVPQLAPGFQRRLLKLILDDGEETLALPKQVERTVDTKLVVATHVGFVRWPRDPENNPLKLNLPVTIVNADKLASVRSRHHPCRRRCRPPTRPPARLPPASCPPPASPAMRLLLQLPGARGRADAMHHTPRVALALTPAPRAASGEARRVCAQHVLDLRGTARHGRDLRL